MTMAASRDSARAISTPCCCAMVSSRHGDARIDVESEPQQDFVPPAMHGAPIDASAPARRKASKQDVFRGAQRRHEAYLLGNRRNSFRDRVERRAEPRRPPSQEDLPVAGREGTREDLDERRLSGAVLADERMDLRRPDLQIDAIERIDARKALRQPPYRDGRRVRRHQSAAPSARMPSLGACMMSHEMIVPAALPARPAATMSFTSAGVMSIIPGYRTSSRPK